MLNVRQQTPVAKRTIDPTYASKDATFDFPLYLSTADKLGALEVVVWDKDMLKKDYLGEAALPLEDWFVDRPFGFEDPASIVRIAWYMPLRFVISQCTLDIRCSSRVDADEYCGDRLDQPQARFHHTAERSSITPFFRRCLQRAK